MEGQLGIKLCEAIEHVAELYGRAMADGGVSPAEDRAIRDALALAVQGADEKRAADDCVLTLLRSGLSPWAVRQVKEQASRHPHLKLVMVDEAHEPLEAA